jgi:hypothetical protein
MAPGSATRSESNFPNFPNFMGTRRQAGWCTEAPQMPPGGAAVWGELPELPELPGYYEAAGTAAI